MKQRFTFIFDKTVKKRGIFVLSAFIIITAFSGTLVACSTAKSSSQDISGTADSASITAISDSDSSRILEVAGDWAEAVKNRDGRAQYELLREKLQEAVYDEYSGLNWVTGTSSPWVESYDIEATGNSAKITYKYATSTGSAGSGRQELSFTEENSGLKISAYTEPQPIEDVSLIAEVSSDDLSVQPEMSFEDLIDLIGLTKGELKKTISEKPVTVDEGGLGFEKTGIRVWFDNNAAVAQVLVMSDKIDINGVKLGESLSDFEKVFGEPISDSNGDAHFKYGNVYLSVNYDTKTDKVIAIYILKENF